MYYLLNPSLLLYYCNHILQSLLIMTVAEWFRLFMSTNSDEHWRTLYTQLIIPEWLKQTWVIHNHYLMFSPKWSQIPVYTTDSWKLWECIICSYSNHWEMVHSDLAWSCLRQQGPMKLTFIAYVQLLWQYSLSIPKEANVSVSPVPVWWEFKCTYTTLPGM